MDQSTSSVRALFATCRLTIKVISKRSGLPLIVQYLEVKVDASAVGHTAFGVMDQAGGDDGTEEAVPPYNGSLNLLRN